MDFVGTKYDFNMDVKDVAKLLRADIKKAVKLNHLPAGNYSVKIDRYSMGQSINVRASELTGQDGNPVQIHEPAFLREFLKTGYCSHQINRHTPEGTRIKHLLEEMLQAYNRDRSDMMTDYFDVKFYGHATFDNSIWCCEMAAIQHKTLEVA